MESIKQQFHVNEDGIGLWQISEEAISKTVEEIPDVLVDLDAQGQVVSIEVINFAAVDEQKLQRVLARHIDLYRPRTEVQLSNTTGLISSGAVSNVNFSYSQPFTLTSR